MPCTSTYWDIQVLILYLYVYVLANKYLTPYNNKVCTSLVVCFDMAYCTPPNQIYNAVPHILLQHIIYHITDYTSSGTTSHIIPHV